MCRWSSGSPPSSFPSCRALSEDEAEQVKEGWRLEGDHYEEPPAPPPPVGSRRTLKSDVWRRATDAEAAAMDQMLNAAPVKLRRLWSDSTILEHDSEEWAAVRDPVAQAFGQARADEILAPSPGA
jgi:hypothetical protein